MVHRIKASGDSGETESWPDSVGPVSLSGRLILQIAREARAAQDRYGDFASAHEALGVLTEEYHELIEAIHSNDLEKMRLEAEQLAAVAMRLAAATDSHEFAWRSGCADQWDKRTMLNEKR